VKNTVEDFIGETPLARLQRLPGAENERAGNVLLAKLEGNNPAGSVKDRPAMSMVRGAEERGAIRRGDTLIEPTSGNTGIALAMAAAIRGYRMVLIMPEHLSVERRQTMRAFGAEIVLTPQSGGMEAARDLAEKMVRDGKGVMLDQFANPDNPLSHYEATGPEIWRDTSGKITHFVSSMGTTGTIMGCSRFFKEKNPAVQIIGCQPEEGSQIPASANGPRPICQDLRQGARRPPRVREPGRRGGDGAAPRARGGHLRGHFVRRRRGRGVTGREGGENAVIVTIICDRGDRYLTTGVFPD
jgi:cysteine synthase B